MDRGLCPRLWCCGEGDVLVERDIGLDGIAWDGIGWEGVCNVT
jgi:hypothetical protein